MKRKYFFLIVSVIILAIFISMLIWQPQSNREILFSDYASINQILIATNITNNKHIIAYLNLTIDFQKTLPAQLNSISIATGNEPFREITLSMAFNEGDTLQLRLFPTTQVVASQDETIYFTIWFYLSDNTKGKLTANCTVPGVT